MHLRLVHSASSPMPGGPGRIHDLVGPWLDDLIPHAAEVGAGTRLGQVLPRVRDALTDGQARRQVTGAFADGILDTVPRLRRHAFVRIGDAGAADDLVRRTLMDAWRNRSALRTGPNLPTWLFTSLRTLVVDRRRRQARAAGGHDAARLAWPPGTEPRAGLARFRVALDDLPHEQRDSILLVELDGLATDEAAVVLGCHPAVVRRQAGQARESLAHAIGAS